MKDDIERYCIGELARMYDAHRRSANLLFDLANRTTLPLLADILRELVAANTWCLEKAEEAFQSIGKEIEEMPNAEVAVIALEAQNEEEEVDDAVRDLMIAQAALRLGHYVLANYTGLASWFRQVGQYGVGTAVDAMASRIQSAVAHLETLQPSLSGLFLDEPHSYHTPGIARPREREPRSDLDGFDRR